MPSFSSWTCDLNTDPGLAAWRDPRHRAAPAAEPSTCPVWVGLLPCGAVQAGLLTCPRQPSPLLCPPHHLPRCFSHPALPSFDNWAGSAWSAQQTGLFELIRVQPLEASSLVPGNVRGAVLPFGKSYECWGFKGGTSESSWHWPRSVPFEVQELPAGCAGSKA